MKTKICTKCGIEYPATPKFFYRCKAHLDNLKSRCKICSSKARKKYHEKTYCYYYEEEKERNRNLKRYYGITLKNYNQMLEQQNYCCAICGIHQSKLKNRLGVDHNHNNSEVRGLLCNNCNRGIGHLGDNPLILIKAAKYLKKE